jgi:predicted nucleotidyltransferase
MVCQAALKNLKVLKYLTEKEKAALSEFLTRLRENYAEQVLRVVLFGSKTRGDFDAESDIDVLVVVKSENWRFHDQISSLALEPMIEHDIVISVLTIGQEFYHKIKRRRTPFYENVKEQGIDLWKNPLKRTSTTT